MHLINVATLELETFYDAQVPKYAILSHTWGEGEVTFKDVTQRSALVSINESPGAHKIRNTCAQAKADGYDYAWVDTCCIDKSSSAELSEAINSMFAYYRDAAACYAFLPDVTKAEVKTSFPSSRWFTRGWTLQELLAPRDVVFYDRDWDLLGSKATFADLITEITGIDRSALRPFLALDFRFTEGPYSVWDPQLRRFCIAKRMSWASRRRTTRIEDTAYCLLGIFDINMPLLYGERERAFTRLQEELIKTDNDDSILAWGLEPEIDGLPGSIPDGVQASIRTKELDCAVLARSPRDFKACGRVQRGTGNTSTSLTISNTGVRFQGPVIPVNTLTLARQTTSQVAGCVAVLSCETNRPATFLGIALGATKSNEPLAEVSRLSYAGNRAANKTKQQTLLLGPRALLAAVNQTITIVTHAGRRLGLQSDELHHFVVKESQALVDAGYSISHVEGVRNELALGWPTPFQMWHADARIFTIGQSVHTMECLWFEVRHEPTGSTLAGVLCRGSPLLGLKRSEIFEEMRWKLREPREQKDVLLVMLDGCDVFMRVDMTMDAVSFKRIHALGVDLLPSTNSKAPEFLRPLAESHETPDCHNRVGASSSDPPSLHDASPSFSIEAANRSPGDPA